MKLKWVRPKGGLEWTLFIIQWLCLVLGIALIVDGNPFAWILLVWFGAMAVYRNRTLVMDNIEELLNRGEPEDEDGGEDEQD